jgi:hypothetical protein
LPFDPEIVIIPLSMGFAYFADDATDVILVVEKKVHKFCTLQGKG